MARGGRADFNVDFKDFFGNLEVLMHHVNSGTKKATVEGAREILDESLKQVPRETNTLASSAFYTLSKYGSGFAATIGYGKGDPINPKTGKAVSTYMVAVHEDLTAIHNVGKAKFLEDPVRQYQDKFAGRAANIIKNETGM